MNIILLSGGSGKRLWPLSNDVRSKQFIKLFKNDDEYESMVQRVYRQITLWMLMQRLPLQRVNHRQAPSKTSWARKLLFV